MAYAALRIYSGTSSRTPEELDHLTGQELVPQLVSAGGLLRYSTVVFSDQRIGSMSVYENLSAASKARAIAAEWVRSTGVMSNYELAESFEGPVVYSLRGEGDQMKRGVTAVARLYATEAAISDIRKLVFEASEAEIKAIPGFMRLTVIESDSGMVGAFSAFETPEGAAQLTDMAKAKRTAPESDVSTLFPIEPETIEGTLLGTYTP